MIGPASTSVRRRRDELEQHHQHEHGEQERPLLQEGEARCRRSRCRGRPRRALPPGAPAGTAGCRSRRRSRRPAGGRARIPLAACDDSGRMGRDETPKRSGARDLERYAGLFAQRTQAMKSSAMRDLMAVTARPEIISLAGGLPDTSTFPAEDFAALMARVAVDASARALQYGPTEGLDEVKDCIVQVMAAEGMEVETEDLLITTGGQQVIDLVCKTLIDPGDVVIAEAPTYPGAVPVFISYQADVVQIEMDDARHADRRAEGRARAARPRGPRAEVHLHGAVVPEPGRRDAVARAPARAGPARPRARAARARGQPVRAAALRGRAAADAVLARPRRVRDLPRHVLEDPLARPAPGLDRRAAAGAREAQPRQGRRRPLLGDAVAAVRRHLLRRARLARLPAHAGRALPAPARRDARGARRAPAARGDVDAARAAACSSGRGCRTTSTPPTCWRGRCARTSPSCPAAPPTSTAAAARRCG